MQGVTMHVYTHFPATGLHLKNLSNEHIFMHKLINIYSEGKAVGKRDPNPNKK